MWTGRLIPRPKVVIVIMVSDTPPFLKENFIRPDRTQGLVRTFNCTKRRVLRSWFKNLGATSGKSAFLKVGRSGENYNLVDTPSSSESMSAEAFWISLFQEDPLRGPKQSVEGTLAGQRDPIGEGEHPCQGASM